MEMEQARAEYFEKVKAGITSAPCLVFIDYTDESNKLFLYIDASLVAFGGILRVKCAEG